ncbi:hypothetical protein BAUCODRAFT_220540 [Baudoinia panamericana UAMH 10762]|uniref:Uncharacterized protein n=1 Tax=Baudoinia panamericana (strain UAMH 10762) TaxID=717646 RepID=M2MC69_BAUPA|nr:uncharacterized protein BAUCODRAFT_220540 [Baudoinia panamericana UAMH 10762]EMC94096.1 hypothetical protein BAUCODRAFT_220540 [Baudoinia panamericana UAMH 10762]
MGRAEDSSGRDRGAVSPTVSSPQPIDAADCGFPLDVFRQMEAGHKKFLRELEEDGRRSQEQDHRPSALNRSFFVTFKDFVDNTASSLADSFRSFPTNVAELKAAMQADRERRRQDVKEMWWRWTGLDLSPDHCQMLRDRASPGVQQEAKEATLMLLKEARRKNAHVSQEKVAALYRDTTAFGSLFDHSSPMLSPGGACYYQSDSGYNAPSTAIWRAGRPDHPWLSTDWFKWSSYSPVHLQCPLSIGHADESSSTSSMKWRAAFEDLLLATLDKPLEGLERIGYRPPHGRLTSNLRGPGLDWMLSLQCRGILPPQLPSYWNSFSRNGIHHALTDHYLESEMKPNLWGRSDMQRLLEEVATPSLPVEPSPPVTELDFQEHLDSLGTTEANRCRQPRSDAVKLPPQFPSAVDRPDDLDNEYSRYQETERMQNRSERFLQESEALQLDAPKFSPQPSLPPSFVENTSSSSLATEQPPAKVDVLSSLTTTQTTRYPDGTVTSKVVLKQRFADGREETSEKVHTYQESSRPQDLVTQPETAKSSEKGGWFWS